MGSSGSGAGGGGGGGGGGGLSRAGAVRVRGGKITFKDTSKRMAYTAIQNVINKLSPDYLSYHLCSPDIVRVYEALFELRVHLSINHSWDQVEERFAVDGGPQCLVRLAAALVPEHGAKKVSERLQAPLKTAVMDFFERIVGDDPLRRDRADAKAVLNSLDKNVFERTSNYFLGAYLASCLRLEETSIGRKSRRYLQDFAQEKADQLISSFENKFRDESWKGVPQVSYPHLLRIMQGERDWTVQRLKDELKK